MPPAKKPKSAVTKASKPIVGVKTEITEESGKQKETYQLIRKLAASLPDSRRQNSAIIAGEFRGDFTRDTFDPPKHYTRVLMQQGRVQLDADLNEQSDIVMHYLRSLAQDIFGSSGGGPYENAGFDIQNTNQNNDDLNIGNGHYYVDGILCENDEDITYTHQPDFPLEQSEKDQFKNLFKKKIPFLVYLDVWERHVTMIQDPKIRESALNGPDTATRSQIIWQVKLLQGSILPGVTLSDIIEQNQYNRLHICNHIRKVWSEIGLPKETTPQLMVKAEGPDDSSQVCNIQPDSRYRGLENQLYRVEIHNPGNARSSNNTDGATFKWSRDNSSIDFPIISLNGTTAILAHLGRDDKSTPKEGDWVEVLDNYHLLRQEPGDLVRIESVDRVGMVVTFSSAPSSIIQNDHALVRRWDQREDLLKGNKILIDGAIPVEEPPVEKPNENWIELEDGVWIQFQPQSQSTTASFLPRHYNTGDYWLIPARTIRGNVVWPWDETGKQPRQPLGIAHHYAPLAVIFSDRDSNNNEIMTPFDCRCIIDRKCYRKP